MNIDETIAWFEEIAAREITFHEQESGRTGKRGFYSRPAHFELQEAAVWLTDARSALGSIFPPGHAVMKQWDAATLTAKVDGPSWMKSPDNINTARAIFQSALGQLKASRLKTLLQSVKAETVTELLDQADALVQGDYLVAGAVIAGGALETHLHHLCDQHGITWKGEGSISKYDQAIAEARKKSGQGVYPATDSKQVVAWGGVRNEAAHTPSEFKRTAEEVRLMVQGIRQFISKTS